MAAGSERLGFLYHGAPCSTTASLFFNNTAHSTLAGIWLQADPSVTTNCTGVTNFTSYLSWDFGLITTQGIPTDVVLTDCNFLGQLVSWLVAGLVG